MSQTNSLGQPKWDYLQLVTFFLHKKGDQLRCRYTKIH